MLSELSSFLEKHYKVLENMTEEEYAKELQKLIDVLRENEEEFYKEVINSDNPNFLITTYYSLYLRFVMKIHLKLHNVSVTEHSEIKDMFNNIRFFGMPILLYLKKKEVLPFISELSGMLLHTLIDNTGTKPSEDSFGRHLFLKIHGNDL